MKPAAVFYLLSYALSLLGNSIAGIALPLIVLQATGSVLSAGVLAASTALPAFLAGLLTGVVIDRLNRRTASVAADLVSAAAIAALPVVDLVSGLSLAWFILFGILGSVGDMPGLTAREAILPAIARSAQIPAEKLIGIRESVGALIMVVGPAAAGGLMLAFDGSAVLWITAATSLAAAAMTLLIPHEVGSFVPGTTAGPSGSPVWNQLQQGWATLFRRDKTLRGATVLTLAMVTVLVALQGIILPAHFSLLNQPGQLGFTLTALAVGTLAGGGLYAGWGSRWARRRWFEAGLAGSVLGVAVVGALPPLGIVFAGAFVLGLASGLLGCVTGVVMIERIPDEMRGRIMGTQNSLALLTAPVGMLAAALMAERHGLGPAGIAVAAVWAVAAAAALVTGTMDRERMVPNEKQ